MVCTRREQLFALVQQFPIQPVRDKSAPSRTGCHYKNQNRVMKPETESAESRPSRNRIKKRLASVLQLSGTSQKHDQNVMDEPLVQGRMDPA